MTLLALLVLLVATPALAADACLGGASVLTDQRALATVAADIDGTCGCPTTGRGSYRRCAKAIVGSAVDGGSLRAECEKTARTDYKTTTCGTSKGTCGRVAASVPAMVDCKLKTTARCADRGKWLQTPCASETHCTDVVTWTAGTCFDPRDVGPRQAGARRMTFTKPSAVVPTETRVLDTVIWYPTTATGPVNSATGGILDAPMDLSDGPHPVLMFSHGLCGVPTQSRFLTPLLATRGYVVIAPSHPGSTIADCIAGTDNLVRSALERPSEVAAVLDQMLTASATPGSPFAGALDATRIGMSGHSFGGFTTVVLVPTDPRFKVAVALAGSRIPPPVITVPLLSMTGDLDSVVAPSTVDADWQAATGPKVLVHIASAGHFAFSDVCLPAFPEDCSPPATLTQDEAHAVVLRWMVPFLERYLRGTAEAEPLLAAPAPPGVAVTRQP